jgi:hypothetical protein
MTAVDKGITGSVHRRTLCVLYRVRPVLYDAGGNDPGGAGCLLVHMMRTRGGAH